MTAGRPQYEVFPVQVSPTRRYDFGRKRGGAPCALGEDIGWRAGNRFVWWAPGSFNQVRGTHQHNAVDLIAPLGARVVAARSGRVVTTWTYQGELRSGVGFNDRAGHFVRIEADDATGGGVDHYSHLLHAPKVRPGQRVRAGQLLGFVGQTGNAAGTCPHLHIQTRDARGRAVNMTARLLELHTAGGWKAGVSPALWAVLGGLIGLVFKGRKK